MQVTLSSSIYFQFSVLAIKSIFPLIQASYRTCVNQQNGQNELWEILEPRLWKLQLLRCGHTGQLGEDLCCSEHWRPPEIFKKQMEDQHCRPGLTARCPLISEMNNTGDHPECQCCHLFCERTMESSIFWNTNLEYQVTGWVTGAGKPSVCGFNLPCIQEASDSRLFPWHMGWVCCHYSWNPFA